ncbi:uncharacterized protein [Hoplias malabaricus]|uniref:uncharacterized protein n=1 Tax=Hoplias malabaricus TaxID=27720 RepID=UPI0034628C1F
MAVKIVLILLLFSVSLGNAKRVLDVECQSAVGVAGENTKIPCSFKLPLGYNDVTIYEAMIIKKGQKYPLLYINKPGNVVKGDPRVQPLYKTAPSLLFTNTTVSDEGEYEYRLQTSRGQIKDGKFRLSVTAEYHKPDIKSWPKVIKVGDRVVLYCNASGGYPAGGIHWFNSTGANWTERATLKIMKRDDKLLTMFSKLPLTVTDLSRKSFRCVVLNSSFSEVGETSFSSIGESWRTGSGEHQQPVLTSLSENTKDGGGAELCCNASSGHPVGTIHWFDSTGANWTERATLKIMEAGKNLLAMSSKLTLTSIDFRLEPFKCVVLNSSFSEVDEAKFDLPRTDALTKPTVVIAGVIVLVILGLVIIFLYLSVKNSEHQQLLRIRVLRTMRMPTSRTDPNLKNMGHV